MEIDFIHCSDWMLSSRILEQQTDLTPVDEVAKCLMDSNASHNENQIIIILRNQ